MFCYGMEEAFGLWGRLVKNPAAFVSECTAREEGIMSPQFTLVIQVTGTSAILSVVSGQGSSTGKVDPFAILSALIR